MLQTSLRHTNFTSTFFSLTFTADSATKELCAKENDIVVHRTTVLNPTWGVRLKNVRIKYRTDTSGVRLCPGGVTNACTAGGEEIVIQIPSVPQQYWGGDEKTVQVRACVPAEIGELDFNVTYSIDIDVDPRRDFPVLDDARSFESNMHVQRR